MNPETTPAVNRSDEPVRYPQNRVLGVIDTVSQVRGAVEALTEGGFLASEVEVLHGETASTKLAEGTGRTGLRGLAMRLIAGIGMPNDETAMKDHYADALAKGQFLVMVLAPTEERKQLATQLLREHDGHFINFLGRFTIEAMVPRRSA
jgi:hypothetical protein